MQQLADQLNSRTSCRISVYDLADTTQLRASLADSYMLTNATPVGMAPDIDNSPIADTTMLHDGLIISDAIYNPRKTKLMADGESRGCSCFNGLYMLLYQGAAAFQLWTGKEMPVQQIKNVLFQ